MKNFKLLFILLIFLTSYVFSASQTNAQKNNFEGNNPPQNRVRLLRELGLNQDQIQQVRQVNRRMRPMRRAAQQKLRIAKQRLDESIYADTADNELIQANIKQVADAQSEIISLKAQTELAIRNILTSEQLVKFREIRKTFQERQKKRQMRRKRNMNRRQKQNRRNPL